MSASVSIGEPKSGREKTALILAGPTASGKSALGIEIANQTGGTIINADASQIYADLTLLTARPEADDLAAAPHRLYGVLPATDPCDAQRWRELAVAALEQTEGLPILVGGTGLYIRALMQGFSDMPEVSAEVRAEATARRKAIGPEVFHAEVAAFDPEAAARLPVGDTQRLIRAWEVFKASGEPISSWMKRPRSGPPAGWRFVTAVVEPTRTMLHERINRRFDLMMGKGALEEARSVAHLDPALPLMKALGVPELLAYLRSEIDLAAAVEQAKASSRQYAKRQSTWFRHQLPDALRIDPQESVAGLRKIFATLA
ncbi:tRNA (adenosine(37)-N6)-dimethylallyltransferase MiaA [Lacibacterium aquatile]|uniref:tRNA dimethylallyltransferase n=1 Tax=Lacibacterium aquatile TaxID=1168082 RepID=A0ABW5DU86_9PROT